MVRPRTAVIGLGSVLMGDDAVGPHVLRHLEAEYELPPGIDLLDLGTPGPELAHIVEGLDALIVADTLRTPGATPGEVRRLRRPEILKGKEPDRLSPHDPSLRGALVAASLLGRSPEEVLLVGIIPEDTHLGIGLTPAVQEAMPKAVAAVAAELRRLGWDLKKRENPQPVEPWWENTPTPEPAITVP